MTHEIRKETETREVVRALRGAAGLVPNGDRKENRTLYAARMFAMTDNPAPELHMILERIKPGKTEDCFQLWVCRNVSASGCKRRRSAAVSRHCENCYLPDEKDRVGDVAAKIRRRDA
jgi:hypothetical protein